MTERRITDLPERVVNIALLGSSTLTHLHAAIVVSALRRGLRVKIYENDYGQYRQEIMNENSKFYSFLPDVTLLSFDPYHFLPTNSAEFSADDLTAWQKEFEADISRLWNAIKTRSKSSIIQQTILPTIGCLFGNNEHKFANSRHKMICTMNECLRTLSIVSKVDVLSVDEQALIDGLEKWHDVALWHRSKQDILPTAAPMYGELFVRLLAAQQGMSHKCLVLDLDNTLWGGVIGDDGVSGIHLGQGSALGEAFSSIQSYAKDLSKRGIILAVCSKNDLGVALEAFAKHPDMVLTEKDISCFVANWENKADNIRFIARSLNIGTDSLVFLDDNPMERDLVRQEIPEVAVPEVLDDPAYYPRAIADAGYFESLGLTEEDLSRSAQYRANTERESLKSSSTNLEDYLGGLKMTIEYSSIKPENIDRCAQLINKTNQFNLLTNRYTRDEVENLCADERNISLHFRLRDKFGDNGIISVITGKVDADVLTIENWLMSCRVLGRGVEKAALNILVREAKKRHVEVVRGNYVPSSKNEMVKDHYVKLGFSRLECSTDKMQENILSIADFREFIVPIEIKGE